MKTYKEAWDYLANKHFALFLRLEPNTDFYIVCTEYFTSLQDIDDMLLNQRYCNLKPLSKNDRELKTALAIISEAHRYLDNEVIKKRLRRINRNFRDKFKANLCFSSHCKYCQKEMFEVYNIKKTKYFCSDKCRVYFAREKPLIDLSVRQGKIDYDGDFFDYQVSKIHVVFNDEDSDNLREYKKHYAIKKLGLCCLIDTELNKKAEKEIETIERRLATYFGVNSVNLKIDN